MDGVEEYEPRILSHNSQEIKLGAEESVDAAQKLTITVANTDGLVSSVEQSAGWKGARLEVRLAFFDLTTGVRSTDAVTMFQGRAHAPDWVAEDRARLSFTNRLSLSRVLLPEVRIQKRCPWRFPANASERQVAAGAPNGGVLQVLQRCGYAPDVAGGCGSLDASGQPYTSCDYTAASCKARGMYAKDAAGRDTRRFGGLQYLPPVVQVRSHNERGSHLSAVIENEAKYNDFIPLVYGTAWIRPAIIFGRNDGNLTRLEVLLSMGPIQGIRKVVVNGIEIPQGRAGSNMTATGWWNPVSDGGRTGGFNLDFVDSARQPVGDPHGSMAVLSVVVPNRVSDGTSTPRVEVLMDGMKLAVYDQAGALVGTECTANPAWVLMDLLRRSGWELSEVDVASFYRASVKCAELVDGADENGVLVRVPRAECHVAVQRRRSIAELVRGIRMGAGLMLGYDAAGRVDLRVEGKLQEQHATKAAGSNASAVLDGGWPAYEFGDGTRGLTDILLQGETSTFRLWSRGSGESPNRMSLDFANAHADYQQDGVSLADFGDIERTGQEVSAVLPAVGVSSLTQALRALRLQLRKSTEGNLYASFRTGARGIGIRPGDIVTVTYLRYGLDRKAFRVVSMSPGQNYRDIELALQVHADEWYGDAGLDWTGTGPVQPRYQASAPRALPGVTVAHKALTDRELEVSLGFDVPRRPAVGSIGVPVLALSAEVEAAAQGMLGSRTVYYALSGVDAAGEEGALSAVARGEVPSVGGPYIVRLHGIQSPNGAVSLRVYRGESTQALRLVGTIPASTETFVDDGSAVAGAGAPDANFDHARAYWRWVVVPAFAATAWGESTVSGADLGLVQDALQGRVIRVVAGPGKGEERVITGNSENAITVESPWDADLSAASRLVVSEASWQVAGRSSVSPVAFGVPWRGGSSVELLLRAVSATGMESSLEESPRALLRLPASPGEQGDTEVPPKPNFALRVPGDGQVELSALSFETLTNTAGIRSGLLRVFRVDESLLPSARSLVADLLTEGTELELNGPLAVGTLLLVGSEVVKLAASAGVNRYAVERGQLGTLAAGHVANSDVFVVEERVFTLSFTPGLFGSESGGSWGTTVSLPGSRVVAAGLAVSNGFGWSEERVHAYSALVSDAFRTGQGGQVVLQVPGHLAVANEAVPRLEVASDVVWRHVMARVGEAPEGGSVHVKVMAGSEELGDLVIAAGQVQSNILSGWNRGPLVQGTLLGLRVLSTGSYGLGKPGKDLTVTLSL